MKKITSSDFLPESNGPYSHAVVLNDVCYTSGQLPIDHETGVMHKEDIEVATKICLNNIERILKTIEKQKKDVVKCNIFLKDIKDYAKVNIIYGEFFGEEKPARSAYQVANLPFDVPIEIEAIIDAKK